MWNVAKVNIARIIADSVNDPIMKTFVDQLDHINSLGEASPGFVWRLKEESGNATQIHFNDDPRVIVNMSVWETVEDLIAFAYKSVHREVMSKRSSWFEKMNAPYQALWYVPKYSFPSVEDSRFRLAYLQQNGQTPMAFTFAKRFSPDDYVSYLSQKTSLNS